MSGFRSYSMMLLKLLIQCKYNPEIWPVSGSRCPVFSSCLYLYIFPHVFCTVITGIEPWKGLYERFNVRLLLRRQLVLRQVDGHGVEELPRGPAEFVLVGWTFDLPGKDSVDNFKICWKINITLIQPWWLGGRVLDNVQTQLMLYFGGLNPAWGDYTRCNYVL